MTSEYEILREIVEESLNPICRLTPDGTVIFANKAFRTTFNLPSTCFLGLELRDLLDAESLAAFEEGCKQLTSLTHSASFKTRVSRQGRDTCHYHWHIQKTFNHEGNTAEIYCIGKNITDLLKAQEELKAEKNRLRCIEEVKSAFFLRLSPDLTILSCNRAYAKYLEGKPEDFIGKKLEEIRDRDFTFLRRAFARLTPESPSVFRENSADFKNGETKWQLFNDTGIFDESGKLHEIQSIAWDITELKRAREAEEKKEAQLKKTIDKLHTTFSQTIDVLATAVESKDPYTAGHQRRTAYLSAAIARRMGLSFERRRCVALAAAIHDLGKLCVPSELLSKPGVLRKLEMDLVKTHAEEGYKILQKVDFPWRIPETIRQHHERLDGSGYPRGLSGDEILPEARIIAVADVVEAMASHQPYREALGIGAALEFVQAKAGKLFDNSVVEACRELFEEGFSLDNCN